MRAGARTACRLRRRLGERGGLERRRRTIRVGRDDPGARAKLLEGEVSPNASLDERIEAVLGANYRDTGDRRYFPRCTASAVLSWIEDVAASDDGLRGCFPAEVDGHRRDHPPWSAERVLSGYRSILWAACVAAALARTHPLRDAIAEGQLDDHLESIVAADEARRHLLAGGVVRPAALRRPGRARVVDHLHPSPVGTTTCSSRSGWTFSSRARRLLVRSSLVRSRRIA